MKIITTCEMKILEEKCLKEYSISPVDLMENAGRGSAEWIKEFIEKEGIKGSVLVVCGGGNNGGDGFTAARILCEMGVKTAVVCLAKEDAVKGPARQNYNRIKKIRAIPLYKAYKEKDLKKFDKLFKTAGLIVDCIMGTGIRGEIKGFFRSVVEYINGLSKLVISVDIPSGMNGDTGGGIFVNSYSVLTLGMPKAGLLRPGAEDKTGYVYVIDIGIPDDLINTIKGSLEYIVPRDFKGVVKRRRVSAHKGSFGRTFILAGSPLYSGAGVLCALGALRAGSGLVTVGVPLGLQKVYQMKLTEAMVAGLPETEDGTLSQEAYPRIMEFIDKADTIAIGPGMGRHPDTAKLIKRVVAASRSTIVIDADGINAAAGEPLVLCKAHAPLILTPHPGEMAGLLHTSVKNVAEDRWGITRSLADKYGITIVLKGAHSVVAGNDKKIYINSSGNPGMASGGMGDALTGIIAAFSAQGLTPLDSARAGVYVHGRAGDIAAEEKGTAGMIAGDLLEKVPCAVRELYES